MINLKKRAMKNHPNWPAAGGTFSRSTPFKPSCTLSCSRCGEPRLWHTSRGRVRPPVLPPLAPQANIKADAKRGKY